MFEKHQRSIVKSLTWRVIATLTTFFLVYWHTRNLTISFSVGIFDVVIKILFYYLHERFWGRISWGRKVIGR